MMPPRAGGIIKNPRGDRPTLSPNPLALVARRRLVSQSSRTFPIGEEVFVVVTLPDTRERVPVNGKVIWVTHRNQGNRPAGFAIQLSGDEGKRLKNEIEKLLAGQINSDRQTFTL
mgnify:CR=1 FL=1